MIRSLGKVLGYVLLSVNVLMALLLIMCAYAPYVNPQNHPIVSCAGLAFPVFLFIVVAFLIFWLISYARYSFVSILAVAICIKPLLTYSPLNISTSDIPDGSIKFLSYNTMAFDGGTLDEDGKNPILEYIKKSDADIVCLQEFIPGGSLSLEKINKELKGYKYSNYHKLANASNGLGIFSRFPILSVKEIDYVSNSNGSVAYKLLVGEDTVTVVNNHFESNKLTLNDKNVYREMIKEPDKSKVKYGSKLLVGKLAQASEIRAAQADSVAKYLSENVNGPIILCGDFNDSPLSYTHRMMDEYLKDAYGESGFGPGISYNQNHFYFRIDHIMISPYMKSYDCTVDRSIKNSDHYPIWCYIKINPL